MLLGLERQILVQLSLVDRGLLKHLQFLRVENLASLIDARMERVLLIALVVDI